MNDFDDMDMYEMDGMAELLRDTVIQNSYYRVLEMIPECESLDDLAKKLKFLIAQIDQRGRT